MYMKPFHSRNDSGELDVFEASRYFAGAAEMSNGVNLTSSHKGCDQKPRIWRTGGPRMSLDMPNIRSGSIPTSLNGHHHHHHLIMENNQKMVVNNKEKKQYKQPSSPGGKLASFLNSLFNQTSSSKKKKPSSKSSTQSMKDDDEIPSGGGRRKRRSSISHFRVPTNHHHHQNDDAKSAMANTPIKVITIPSKSSVTADQYAWLDDNKFQWDRKHRIYANGYSDQKEIIIKKNQLLRHDHDHDHDHDQKDDDDGTIEDDDGRRNSDSSSDLFELQNYNLGYDQTYDSCGLPVYETTNMDSIKISSIPISSGTK